MVKERAKDLDSSSGPFFVLFYKKKEAKKQSRQQCEHTDPATLNLTAPRLDIPDTSDDNFTTGFRPPLQWQIDFHRKVLTWANLSPYRAERKDNRTGSE